MKQNTEQKVIKVDLAVHLLNLLIPAYCHVQNIVNFLQSTKSYKVINQDQWRMILAFSMTVGPEFQGYSIEGAWPVLLDEFVYWATDGKQTPPQQEEAGILAHFHEQTSPETGFLDGYFTDDEKSEDNQPTMENVRMQMEHLAINGAGFPVGTRQTQVTEQEAEPPRSFHGGAQQDTLGTMDVDDNS